MTARQGTGGTGHELKWVQRSAGKQAHELRAGDEVTGSLVWQRGSLAVGEIGERRWTIQIALGAQDSAVGSSAAVIAATSSISSS